MNKIIRTVFILIGFTIGVLATSQMEYKNIKTIKPMSTKQMKKMDHSHTKHKAIKRSFKNKKEFQRKSKRKLAHKSTRNLGRKPNKHNRHTNNRYNNGDNYDTNNYRNNHSSTRQRGYRYPNRGWLLAYRYDRASFYDHEGFYYGFFNRHGYYFENVFYRYDRYYTFRDRVKGRGLFDHRYYMPENSRYYGFCSSREYARAY